jgi:ATP:ADP antiporter, AAA family
MEAYPDAGVTGAPSSATSRRTPIAFGLLFLVIAAYQVLKAVRNALFIHEFGALKLPYAMLGVALLAGLAAGLYLRLARGRSVGRMAQGLYLFLAANLLAFWLLAWGEPRWLYPLLYLWVGVYGVLATTQVWALTNEVFTSREAKRTFGMIAAGGTLGAVVGGLLARLAKPLGAPNLLLVALLLLIGSAFFARALAAARPREAPSPVSPEEAPSLGAGLASVAASRHLRLVGALVLLTAIVTTSVEFQFNLVAEAALPDRDALAGFLGTVYAVISAVAFLVQVLATGPFLRHLGLGLGLLLLPMAMTGGTACLLAFPSLWAAVALKGSDGSLKHSLDRSCRELLYIPVAPTVRRQAKFLIDTVFDRLGDGLAGLLQLVLTGLLGLGLAGSLGVNGLLLAIWLPLAVRLRHSYTQELTLSLGKGARADDPGPWLRPDADTRRLVEGLLLSPAEEDRLAAVELCTLEPALCNPEILQAMVRDDPSPRIRVGALRSLLERSSGPAAPSPPARFVELEGRQVAVLVDLLTAETPALRAAALEVLLEQGDPDSRDLALAALLRGLGPDFTPFIIRVLEGLSAEDAPPSARRAAAELIGHLPAEGCPSGLLGRLLVDPEPEVASAAAHAVARSGRTDGVPRLIHLLGRLATRGAARQALERLGDRVVAPLLEALRDPSTPELVRGQLPRLLARTGSKEALDALRQRLTDGDAEPDDAVLDALHHLRRMDPEMEPVERGLVETHVRREVRRWIELRRALDLLRAASGAETSVEDCLEDTLMDRERVCLRRVFQLLGLAFPSEEMDRACSALLGGGPRERANALEYLDNVLPHALRKDLLLVLETRVAIAVAEGSSTELTRAHLALLQQLALGGDPWIAACALHRLRARSVHAPDWVAPLTESVHPAVREEALRFSSDARKPRVP